MRRLILVLPFLLIAALALAGSAQAAVTASVVTSPADGSFIRFDGNSTATIAASGSTNGTTGDAVDLYCTRGTGTRFNADAISANVPVAADGTFTYNSSAGSADRQACVIRALPHGAPVPTATTDLSTFNGPRVFLGEVEDFRVPSGSNGGTLYDYYIFNSQTQGGMDFDSLGSCGLDDSFVYNPLTLGKSNALFFCNAYLWSSDGDSTLQTRSEAQIDGQNAYPPGSAAFMFDGSQNIPGFLGISYSPSFAPGSGDLAVTETDPFLVCPGNPFPATSGNCQTFNRAPVDVRRTIAMGASGRQVQITDVFTSRDGASHVLDLLYEQDQRDNDNVTYRFPWRDTAFNQHALQDSFRGPGSSQPGSIFIKGNKTALDGDETSPQGAITYSSPPDEVRFLGYPTRPNAAFALHYRRRVPGSGSLTLTWVYSNAFLSGDVNAMAAAAEAALAPIAAAGGTPVPGGGGTPGGSGGKFAGVRVRGHRLTVRHGRARITLACPAKAAGACKGTATLTARTTATGKRKRAPALYGRAHFRIRSGKHKTIAIKLKRAGRVALRRHHGHLRAQLVVTAHDRAGSSRTTVTTARLARHR